MHTDTLQSAQPLLAWLMSFFACIALIGAPLAAAQAPAASGNAAEAPSPEVLDKLVGRIALYPDDLVALILPASTNPLQLVQADRFLDKRKSDPKLPIDDNWDDSVKSLVNYPEVVKQMSDDLDWTADLGEAVVANQGAVLDAVQAFRRKAQSAENLKSDDKQTVVVEKEIIKIVPADPQVIYVPQYNPSSVVVVQLDSGLRLLSCTVSELLLPVPAGRRARDRPDLGRRDRRGVERRPLWRQLGRWQQQHHDQPRHTTSTPATSTAAIGNRPSQQPGGGGTAWKSDKKPGQVSSGAGRGTRTGACRRRGVAGGGAGGRRPSAQAGGRCGRRRGGRTALGATGRRHGARRRAAVSAPQRRGWRRRWRSVMRSAATDREAARARTARAARRAAARCRAAAARRPRRRVVQARAARGGGGGARRRWRWSRRRRTSLGDGRDEYRACNHPSDRHHEPPANVEADTRSRFHRSLRDAGRRYRARSRRLSQRPMRRSMRCSRHSRPMTTQRSLRSSATSTRR